MKKTHLTFGAAFRKLQHAALAFRSVRKLFGNPKNRFRKRKVFGSASSEMRNMNKSASAEHSVPHPIGRAEHTIGGGNGCSAVSLTRAARVLPAIIASDATRWEEAKSSERLWVAGLRPGIVLLAFRKKIET